MSRYRDNSGVGNTCPLIDEVISAIKHADWSDEYHSEKELIDLMEEIRTANATLREWGNEGHRERDELENDIDTLNRKISDLESDLDYYRKRAEDLEKQLDEVEI